MTAAIPVGTIVTYESDDWHTGKHFYRTKSDALRIVELALVRDGFRTNPGSETSQTFGEHISGLLPGDVRFSVVLYVQVAGGRGYSRAEDVASIINHEEWRMSNIFPGRWNITNVALPAPGTGGEPEPVHLCGKGFIEGIKSFLGVCVKPTEPAKDKRSFLDRLTSNITLYVGLGVLGFVAALFLIGYSGALRRA